VRQIEQSVQAADFNARTGFFPGFPCRAFKRGFAVFHKTCGQRPQPVFGLNRATT